MGSIKTTILARAYTVNQKDLFRPKNGAVLEVKYSTMFGPI